MTRTYFRVSTLILANMTIVEEYLKMSMATGRDLKVQDFPTVLCPAKMDCVEIEKKEFPFGSDSRFL